jgi:N-acetylneuraminic acid mutarotase
VPPVGTVPDNLVAVRAGNEMLIHGTITRAGLNVAGATFAYHPATNTWTRLAQGPVPLTTQNQDVAVSTGRQMIVAGLTNGIYNTVTGTWRRIPQVPSPVSEAVTAWTGRQMIIWDGICCADISNSGVAYSPATNRWTQVPAAPLELRREAMGAWTGSELVVAGGNSGPGVGGPRTFRDAAAYNPATRTWRRLPPMPVASSGGTAVWDGREVLLVGGTNAQGSPVAGAAFDLATNRWHRLPAMPFPRSQ